MKDNDIIYGMCNPRTARLFLSLTFATQVTAYRTETCADSIQVYVCVHFSTLLARSLVLNSSFTDMSSLSSTITIGALSERFDLSTTMKSYLHGQIDLTSSSTANSMTTLSCSCKITRKSMVRPLEKELIGLN
jgi:hypothetical protein